MFDSSSTLDQFLSATAARQPTPGGGSVTALVSALGAALGEMVLNYSIGRKGHEAFESELRPALEELQRARKLLLQLMVEDQLAYEALTAARKLPQGSPERAASYPPALLACIRIPQSIAATGVAILKQADDLVSFINPWLLSDLAVCCDLTMASIRCAIYNVRVNLKSIENEDERKHFEGTIGQILSHALTLIQSVNPRIWDRDAQGI